MVLVADIDMLTDEFFRLREQGEVPGMGMTFDFDNTTFVLNAIDSLAGEDRFLELRKRRPKHRTLTRIEERLDEARKEESEARDDFRKEKDDNIKKESDKLNEEMKKLDERLREKDAKIEPADVEPPGGNRPARRPAAGEGPQGRIGRDLPPADRRHQQQARCQDPEVARLVHVRAPCCCRRSRR